MTFVFLRAFVAVCSGRGARSLSSTLSFSAAASFAAASSAAARMAASALGMERNDYRPRVIDRRVEEYLSAFGAVCIEGPKWCGKTWTSAYHCKSEILIGDPAGNFQNRKLAELQPSLVLEGETPRLIDEWQEVPPLWDAVRYMVDERAAKGQFILTGSATPNHKGILHSGAGRIAKLRMRPMKSSKKREI